jgi:hypothetical protein
MIFLLILAIIIGLMQSQQAIYNVRNGLEIGVPESNSLIDFTFLNR